MRGYMYLLFLWVATHHCLLTTPPPTTSRLKERLSSVDLLQPDQFPVAELVQASFMDSSQVDALRAILTRELAVVQGPPGTGELQPCTHGNYSHALTGTTAKVAAGNLGCSSL